MFIAIVSLIVFALLLFFVSFGAKKFDAEANYDELHTKQTVEFYKINKRLKVLEEELMVEYKE